MPNLSRNKEAIPGSGVVLFCLQRILTSCQRMLYYGYEKHSKHRKDLDRFGYYSVGDGMVSSEPISNKLIMMGVSLCLLRSCK